MTAAPNQAAAVQTRGLGKRYGTFWALQECSLDIPAGRISALVGPNGAGKTTLLRLLVGLSKPSAGEMAVLGRVPEQSGDYLQTVGYLAQDAPLYKRLSAADHLALGAALNPRWDDRGARERLDGLGIDLDRPVGKLSGGQRSQVALAVALAKRPALLLLDEPVAALDPLARRDFLASLTRAVADGGLSIVMSSHLLRDLAEVCDHLVVLAAARTQLCGDIEDIVADHCLLVGPRQGTGEVARHAAVIAATHTASQSSLLVRLDPTSRRAGLNNTSWEISEVGLEEIVLAYMGQENPSRVGPLAAVGSSST